MNIDYSKRITAERITELKPQEVFVFGSNLAGIHGAGAAKLAYEKFGAKWGYGKGLYGQSYALPTKNSEIRTMHINNINDCVRDFIWYADQHPELIFLVTEIGCGLAGLEPKDIAPMFKDCIHLPNVHLPQRFWDVLLADYVPVAHNSHDEYVTIPLSAYNVLRAAAQSYSEDLDSGLEDGTYDEGEETLDELTQALAVEPVKPKVYVFVEGGNIQGASANMSIEFNVFDKDNFNAPDYDGEADDLKNWNTMINEGHETCALKPIY